MGETLSSNLRNAPRIEQLMPGGAPRWIRCYDNGGGSADRYTVVFTGNYAGREGRCQYVGMSSDPFSPQGICQHDEHDRPIDRPKYSHLGKRIQFTDLPEDCQQVVIRDYKEIWRLENGEEEEE